MDELDFDFLRDLHDKHKKEIKNRLSKIRTAKPESVKEPFQDYIDFLMQHVKEQYLKKGVRRHIKKVEIGIGVLVGGAIDYALIPLMPYLNPGISFALRFGGGASVGGIFSVYVTGLIDEKIHIPIQTARCGELEKYLKKSELGIRN